MIFAFQLFAQTPSVVRNIRLPLWAELDAYPGLVPVDSEDKDENRDWSQFDFPIKQMHKIAPFIISGMVYGWNFVYVPYDKARGVEEYLEVTEIVASDVIKGGITYSSPWLENNNLNCWVEYTRTDSQGRTEFFCLERAARFMRCFLPMRCSFRVLCFLYGA